MWWTFFLEVTFLASLGEFGKNSFAPPKICLLLHLCILKQLQTHFKTKHEKVVGTPFPRAPAPLHPLGALDIYPKAKAPAACNFF